MTDRLREAARAALEALVWEVGSEPALYAPQTLRAINALRAALAEQDDYEDYRLRIERLVRQNQKLQTEIDWLRHILEKDLPENAKAVRPSPPTEEDIAWAKDSMDGKHIENGKRPATEEELAREAQRLCHKRLDNPASFIFGWRAAEAWHEIRHREWQSLTDEEVERVVWTWSMLNSHDKLAELVRLAERFVKEKNT